MIDLFGQEQDDNPRKRDATNADRQARFVAQRTEITGIPNVLDPERRERAWDYVVAFGMAYCMADGAYKGLLKRTPSQRLRDFAHKLQQSIEDGGLMHIRLPRGAGKTTWIKIAIIWGLSTGRIKFGLAVAASGPLASKIIKDVWDCLETSDRYAEDFPEVSFPIRSLEGMFQRAAGQVFNGVRTQISRNANQINLPIIVGAASSGGMLIAKGAGCALRGLVDGSRRPDYVLLDDIQTRKDALSPTKIQHLVDWVQQDILGLGGDTMLPVGMASTPIMTNDFSEQFADPKLHPEWETISFPLVISWPRREDLWDQYLKLYAVDKDSAFEFYRSNQAEMDEGADLFDHTNYDPKRELSAVQHAYNLIFRMNSRDSFNAEYMLATRRSANMMTVDAKTLMTRTNGYERGTMPPGTLEAVAFVDIMADAGLYFCVVAFGPRQTAAIIDYGVYPGDGKRLVPINSTELEIKRLLAEAELKLVNQLLMTGYRRSDGKIKTIHACWLDHGWESIVGVRICDLMRKRGHANTFTCAGRSSVYYDANGKHVVASGFQVDFREAEGVRFAMQNSDFWKETAQRSFNGTPLQPGSVSLWGNDPEEHKEFCTQAASETLKDKAISSKGVEIYKWVIEPGKKNHFLDTLSGCFAMASWYRFWDNTDVFRKVAIETATPVDSVIAPPVSRGRFRRRCRAASVPIS